MAILSFRGKGTQEFFEGKDVLEFLSIARVAERKLAQLHAAASLEALRAPLGNRLKRLKDDRDGQHGIRINDQHRVCFRWTDAGPEDVEIVDYH
jgi:proteic killer suppression protein